MAKKFNRQNGSQQRSGNAHDKFFRSLFWNTTKIKAILKLAFSAQQLTHFDLSTIVIEQREWLDADEMREHRADLVVTLRLKSGQDMSIYVLTEHKSQPDKELMVQLLKYQTHLYVHQAADAVLPVVVYHGRRQSWPSGRTFLQFRKLPGEFTEDFNDMLLNFGVSLVNLRLQTNRSRLSEVDLDVGLGLKLLADIWEADEKTFAKLMEQSLALPEKVRMSLIRRSALYLQKIKPEVTIDSMNKEIQKRLPGDKAMQTIAEEWSWLTKDDIMESRWLEGLAEGKSEGLAEGYAKAKQEYAQRLVNKGMSDDEVSEITDLTLDEIRQLKNGSNSHR